MTIANFNPPQLPVLPAVDAWIGASGVLTHPSGELEQRSNQLLALDQAIGTFNSSRTTYNAQANAFAANRNRQEFDAMANRFHESEANFGGVGAALNAWEASLGQVGLDVHGRAVQSVRAFVNGGQQQLTNAQNLFNAEIQQLQQAAAVPSNTAAAPAPAPAASAATPGNRRLEYQAAPTLPIGRNSATSSQLPRQRATRAPSAPGPAGSSKGRGHGGR